ncbi:hypothetical protein A2Y85_00545 [candidate division WOR-3 bacterium RBG_13_43_14]|uniref:Competence protein ComEA n=1 Tax=candidate division WOR-3 bacterium RBG_13_43_14 TaxID=1802590 RepID=A0A1F4UEB1_UNCW3|nr:MAG: hypothetical protein A2Y85_00545 [candidate division WOR-3 bacterium RBG_13_43_14]
MKRTLAFAIILFIGSGRVYSANNNDVEQARPLQKKELNANARLLQTQPQLDLNRASLTELYRLPIDSTIVDNIYDHRKLYGPFASVYELRNIDGIGAITFEKIKPYLKIANPFPARSEWGSILMEEKKLASEEPPSKAAVDEWEDLILAPMNVNTATFDQLLMIDRMTPIDAAAVKRQQNFRPIKSSRDLNRIKDLSHYAYVSLRRYVNYQDEKDQDAVHGRIRIKLMNTSRLDIGEDNNIAARISYLEQAKNSFDSIAMNLRGLYDWDNNDCERVRQNLIDKLDYLNEYPNRPRIAARFKGNYQRKLRLGVYYNEFDEFYKGYVGLSDLGPVQKFMLGNYRIAWAEGLLIDNSDELRSRTFDRSKGIFGDLTEFPAYMLFGAAGDFNLRLFKVGFLPAFFYSQTERDAIVNPDGSIWRIDLNSMNYDVHKNRVSEQIYGGRFNIEPLTTILPGAHVGFEAMKIEYDHKINPDPKWTDIPLDKYDPWFYPEITLLSTDSSRLYYGTTFLLPYANTFISGEITRQHLDDPAYGYCIRARIQYDYFYINALYRHYDIAYDNPFNRGFAEYRRFEDTPFERPYALIDPEYISVYDDPTPKPEQGIYLETRYQLSRHLLLSRAYLDVYKNLCHNLNNQRAYIEFEIQPVFPVRIRIGQKYMTKYLARPIESTASRTSETSLRIFFYLSNYDALRMEARSGSVAFTATEGNDMNLTGGFLSTSIEHNFSNAFSVEAGIAAWSTDGMSQWIFEDVGIDFLSGTGMKYYVVASQKFGNLLMKMKFRQKFTDISHTNLFNNPDIYYPDLPGATVYDYINHENTTTVNMQMDYVF